MKAILVIDEMPKDCYDCPLSREDEIYGQHTFICTGYNAEIEDLSIRADWCPLISLPKGHGRLIDADELKTLIPTIETEYKYVHRLIDEAPTIIEADKGETE